LDWAKRIKDAGWEVWYNGQVEVTHVKEAASRQSSKSRIDFYEAMWIFYAKHYRAETNWWLDQAIKAGIVVKGGIDVARHLWDFTRRATRDPDGRQPQRTSTAQPPAKATHNQPAVSAGTMSAGTEAIGSEPRPRQA
jgi:GT2 family glycosyltransferase